MNELMTKQREVDLTLVESREMRDKYISKDYVLDKVKALTMLPDDMHVTVQMVADYYEVSKNLIDVMIKNHKDEFVSDGIKVLRGNELKEAKQGYLKGLSSLKFTSQLTLLPRRSVLRVGMLLRDSEVAKKVRDYLLNTETIATEEQKIMATEALRFDNIFEAIKSPDFLRYVANALEEREKLKMKNNELHKEVKSLQPKAEMTDRFLETNSLHSINEVAKILNNNWGKFKLFQFLREQKVFYRENGNNMPYQEYINKGYFEVKEVTKNNMSFPKILATAKGVQFIFDLVRKYEKESGYQSINLFENEFIQ
jgi:phage antirepressor YoqD-like protein